MKTTNAVMKVGKAMKADSTMKAKTQVTPTKRLVFARGVLKRNNLPEMDENSVVLAHLKDIKRALDKVDEMQEKIKKSTDKMDQMEEEVKSIKDSLAKRTTWRRAELSGCKALTQ